MGLFARFDFYEVRGLVFFLNSESRMMTSEKHALTVSAALRCSRVFREWRKFRRSES
jgi:hypothetical protein